MRHRLITICAIAILLATLGWSQETRATIVGRVSDASGAVVPNATVQVVNKAMGTTVTLETNHEGLYTAPLLIPGMYQVSITAAGFKKFIRDNVQLQVADRIEINGTLEIGTAEQAITVNETAPLLGTETASMGSVITSRQIMDLPLSYGNPFALIGVSTGTGFVGSPRLDRPFEPTHIANFTMNGVRGDRSDITIDGAPATATADPGQVIASYVPPTDILSEFKVQTSNFDASVGQTEGGSTNMSIKSGSNAYHGTTYYTLMRKPTWANDFFNNRLGKERPDFQFDRYGGSLGGPISIPKIYDGKNRTFFLFGYENIQDSRPRYDATTPQVPSAAMKAGDFSSLLALGAQYQIYNPYSRKVSGTVFAEDPFAGNIIPTSLFNPVGKAILDKYFPAPTSAGKSDGTENLLRPELAEKADYYTWTGRVDQNIGDKQRLYGRFSMYRRTSNYNNYFDTTATGIQFAFDSYNGVLDHTFILSPTTVLDLRYGYNRFIRYSDGNADGVGFDLTQIGLPASYNNLIPAGVRRFPRIDLTGYIGTGFTGEYRPVDTHSFSAGLTKAWGAHSLRAGVDWRAYRENDGFFSNDQTMRLLFDGTYTKGPLSTATSAPNSLGQSVAALLLGVPTPGSSSYIARTANYAEQSMAWGVFLQDDWKISQKLTLNLGLRWEMETPLKERYDRTVRDFDPNFIQPFTAAAEAKAATISQLAGIPFKARGGLVFNDGQALYKTPRNNFMPRFGFAYQVQPTTVIRGGFGLYSGFLGERRGDVIQTGYSRSTSYNLFAADNTTITANLSNPFPTGVLEPVGSGQGGQTNVGQNISFFNQNPKIPVNYRWQMAVQKQLPGAWLVEAAYIGNKGIRYEITRNLNALPLQYLSTSLVRDNANNTAVTGSVTNPFAGLTMPLGTPTSLTNNTISKSTLLLPYPQFGAVNTTTNEGYTWYHAAQLRIEKRFAKGLTVNANYTWSKLMQATELLNAADPRPTEMISDQDTPHRIAMSTIYQLPFGKGKKWGSSTSGVVERFIGGWEVTGIWSFQSGTPLPFSSYSTTTSTNNGDIFLIDDISKAVLPVGQRSPDGWFSTSPFVKGTSDQPVSHLRTLPYRFSGLRGPRVNNVDFAVIKDTRIGEGKHIRFSAQAMNTLNHPLFSNPNLTVTAATFAQITSSTQNNYPRRMQFEFKFIF